MRKIDKLLFGTAGIPISANGNTIAGIKQVKKLGFDAMELEFVYGINISKEMAKEVKKTADENNITLTCHAPYYINLNAKEKKKAEYSIQRIILSAERAFSSGAWSVAFHPGYNMQQKPEIVFENIRKRIKEIAKALKDRGIMIWLRPETTGRLSQFGTLNEICRLSQEIENVLPCIDFGHMHAREGKNNTISEFRDMLELVEKTLGKTGLNNIHAHVSGINYTAKGEKNHLNLEDSDLNYKDLVKAWKEFKLKGIVISESPNIEKDALLLKKLYRK